MVDINFRLADCAAHCLWTVTDLFSDHHFLFDAAAFFGDWLLVMFDDLDVSLLWRCAASRGRTAFDLNVLIVQHNRFFDRSFDDVRADAVALFGCAFADR